MKLAELSGADVRRAAALYLERAWPPEHADKPHKTLEVLEGAETLSEVLCRSEEPMRRSRHLLPRFSLRLGNWRYPFMKLVVQEYLFEGEYFFEVDTHDDLDVSTENPDYEGWQEIKRFNRELKDRIEDAWRAEGFPTNADLLPLAEAASPERLPAAESIRLLVVDDDCWVARALVVLFSSRGYVVESAHDGREVLERLARDPLPDLVVLDFSMPELDGREVLRRARGNPRLADLRILLATARAIDLRHMQDVTGFLQKPYRWEVLDTMVAKLLEERG